LKPTLAAVAAASGLWLGGCADPIEKPPTQEAAEHFQRGITGQGRLGPLDRSDDPYVRPAAADSHP
jgi:hypothetical protein